MPSGLIGGVVLAVGRGWRGEFFEKVLDSRVEDFVEPGQMIQHPFPGRPRTLICRWSVAKRITLRSCRISRISELVPCRQQPLRFRVGTVTIAVAGDLSSEDLTGSTPRIGCGS